MLFVVFYFRARLTRTRVKWRSWRARTHRDWTRSLFYCKRRRSLNRCSTHDRNHWVPSLPEVERRTSGNDSDWFSWCNCRLKKSTHSRMKSRCCRVKEGTYSPRRSHPSPLDKRQYPINNSELFLFIKLNIWVEKTEVLEVYIAVHVTFYTCIVNTGMWLSISQGFKD